MGKAKFFKSIETTFFYNTPKKFVQQWKTKLIPAIEEEKIQNIFIVPEHGNRSLLKYGIKGQFFERIYRKMYFYYNTLVGSCKNVISYPHFQ